MGEISETGANIEWLLGLLAAGSAAAVATRLRGRRLRRQQTETELTVVRKLAEEDVIQLGEELQRLDSRVAGHTLDQGNSSRCADPAHFVVVTEKLLKSNRAGLPPVETTSTP